MLRTCTGSLTSLVAKLTLEVTSSDEHSSTFLLYYTILQIRDNIDSQDYICIQFAVASPYVTNPSLMSFPSLYRFCIPDYYIDSQFLSSIMKLLIWHINRSLMHSVNKYF